MPTATTSRPGWGGGLKALITLPLKKDFFAASLRIFFRYINIPGCFTDTPVFRAVNREIWQIIVMVFRITGKNGIPGHGNYIKL